MDPLTDEQRIAGLTRELGDLDLAERLVDARGALVRAVPDHVARTHLSAILVASCARSVAGGRLRTASPSTTPDDPGANG